MVGGEDDRLPVRRHLHGAAHHALAREFGADDAFERFALEPDADPVEVGADGAEVVLERRQRGGAEPVVARTGQEVEGDRALARYGDGRDVDRGGRRARGGPDGQFGTRLEAIRARMSSSRSNSTRSASSPQRRTRTSRAGHPGDPVGDDVRVVQDGTGLASADQLPVGCVGPIGEGLTDRLRAFIGGDVQRGRAGQAEQRQGRVVGANGRHDRACLLLVMDDRVVQRAVRLT